MINIPHNALVTKLHSGLFRCLHWDLFLVKSVSCACLFCPCATLPVQTLLHSWTSSGPWMAHCYTGSSVAVWADAMSSRNTGPCTRLVSTHSPPGRKLRPANTQTLCAQLRRHWRSAASWFLFERNERFQAAGEVAPRRTIAALAKRSRTDSWALNFLPRCSWGQQLGGREGQAAVRGRLLVNCRTCFDWVPVAWLPHGGWRWCYQRDQVKHALEITYRFYTFTLLPTQSPTYFWYGTLPLSPRT